MTATIRVKMDLSSLSEALSKIDTDGDYVSILCMSIINDMSRVAEEGHNTLTYKPPETYLITPIRTQLLNFFPDIHITTTDTTLVIDWS